jgi:hypothetical protein
MTYDPLTKYCTREAGEIQTSCYRTFSSDWRGTHPNNSHRKAEHRMRSSIMLSVSEEFNYSR